MSTWAEIERAAPELSRRARASFDAGIHKTLATLRRDGSPRISATEIRFLDGRLYLGSMWQALKALDLQRDPRFALHCHPVLTDEADSLGDAKLAGRAVEILDEAEIRRINGEHAGPGRSHLFELDIQELSHLRVGRPGEYLVLEIWTPDGLRSQILR
jgi:hypothetical protein